MNKLERKFGKFAIPNLTLVLICIYGLGYIISVIAPTLLNYLYLEPYYVFNQGQVWRLITWIIIPPFSRLDFFTLIALYFYYSIGTALERSWGAFRYNVYILAGILFTTLGIIILYLGFGLWSIQIGYTVTMYYILLSIFLAFAATYPNVEVLLFFVLPVKIKWLAALDLAIIFYGFIQTGFVGKYLIIVSLLNFIIFFIAMRKQKGPTRAQMQRKKEYKHRVAQALHKGPKHKCAICGRTEEDDPNLEFRFCSKCKGNYEYCQDHLFTHEHRTK